MWTEQFTDQPTSITNYQSKINDLSPNTIDVHE